ncbi:MAG: hypothetical protein Q9221_003310 [Calogaya cf. arnoldii]
MPSRTPTSSVASEPSNSSPDPTTTGLGTRWRIVLGVSIPVACLLLVFLIYWGTRRRRRSIKHDTHANEVSPPAVPGYEKPELQGTGICELADVQLPELNFEQVHEAYGGPKTAELHPTHLLEMDASNLPELDAISTSIGPSGGKTESVPKPESLSQPRQKPLPEPPSANNRSPLEAFKIREAIFASILLIDPTFYIGRRQQHSSTKIPEPHPKMATPNESHLIRNNRKYAKTFDDGDLSHIPTKKYAVVTCMDCRIDPYSAFGIHLGDAHIIRNAGGSAHDALRSLIISQQYLQTNEIFIIKHTECGMMGLTNDGVDAVVVKNLGVEALEELNGLSCGAGGEGNGEKGRFEWFGFPNLDQAVRDDVRFLRESKSMKRGVSVSGWVYDVEHGTVRRVEK